MDVFWGRFVFYWFSGRNELSGSWPRDLITVCFTGRGITSGSICNLITRALAPILSLSRVRFWFLGEEGTWRARREILERFLEKTDRRPWSLVWLQWNESDRRTTRDSTHDPPTHTLRSALWPSTTMSGWNFSDENLVGELISHPASSPGRHIKRLYNLYFGQAWLCFRYVSLLVHAAQKSSFRKVIEGVHKNTNR